MAVVIPGPPALAGELALFHTTDPLLSNSPVLVFHGPAATIGAASSRIQVHVFTPAGIGSYSRLAVAPNSPFWSAVDSLPRDAKGDEVCRGIAFGLKKYFSELPESVKKAWCTQVKAPSAGMLFGDQHVAILASRMQKIENTEDVIQAIGQAFAEQRQSWLDVDVVLPPGCIKETSKRTDSVGSEDLSEADMLHQRYGRYAELIAALGDTTFMPTSKMKRAPSKSTSMGRSASFLRHQKESVRKELTELVETEASYLDRIKDLQGIAATIGADLTETGRQQIRSVFPETLRKIVEVNSKFWEALRALLDDTETSALADIEITSETEVSAQQIHRDLVEDAQGVVAVAKCLCEWLPQFAEAYQPYLQAHADASQTLRSLFRSTDTALAAELQEIGEQKLCSLLIEPVQRLPRYNLYIDGMTKQLPARHPAIKHLLKARDVVTDICSSDDAGTEIASMEEKLRLHVADWPANCHLAGRLVTVVDYTSLAPPFMLPGSEAERGLLLVFTDGLVFLEKRGESAIGARALQTQLEAGTMAPRPLSLTTSELSFVRRVQLNACDCVESQSGRVLQIYTRFQLDLEAMAALPLNVNSCHTLFLEGSYDGKAARLVEDILKARIEARFSEPERESQKWEVRASDASADYSSLLSAIYEDSDPDLVAGRQGCATTRILIDIDKHSLRPRAGQGGIKTVIAVSPLKDGLWRMTVDSIDGNATREHLAMAEIMQTLSKRLAQLSVARFAIQQPTMTSCLLSKTASTIASIDLQVQVEEEEDDSITEDRERYKRPKSPRKLITSFLASTGPGSQPPTLLKKDLPALPPPSRSTASGQLPSKPPSRESRPSSKDQPRPHTSYSVTSKQSVDSLTGPLKRLEDSLKTFILALKARKGNIVGRSLKMRATADELAVNELYNGLLEDPNMMVLAAQATVDVLFAAFEKFLNIAWKEQVGQVISYSLIQDVQSKAESMFPADFDHYFRMALSTLSPQNKRAFKGIMELLADLLDGTGNDGDRGALTAAFAEVLVTEGNPHDFIALIDRFVDDTDTYFGEPIEDVVKAGGGQGNMHKRARSVNSASISSNTSSLRRKFGFGHLHRTNSKSEEESKVSAVWRTLSKSTRGEASPASSISRATLHRSHSTDLDARLNPKRPSSQDGPTLKPSPFDDVPSLAASSAQSLGTIGEHPSFIPTGPPRKKRRSSLSDLNGTDDTPKAQTWMTPSASRRPPLFARATSPDPKTLLSSPPQATPSSKPDFGKLGSPFGARETPRSRLPSSFRRENSPVANKAFGVVEPLQMRRGSKQIDEVTISSRPSTSGIPTLAPKSGIPQKAASPSPRVGLSERAGAGNIVKRPATSGGKVDQELSSTPVLGTPQRKLRMQSPQKLRERFQNEQGSLTATQTSLQDELAKIGEELTATATAPGRTGSNRNRANTIGARNGLSGKSSSTDLAARVLKMEGTVVKLGDDFKARLDAMQADLSSSLTVSENKCKKLDELYREVHSENDALYTRFNDELSRVLKAVRGGEGVEELKKQLKESQEEAAKLRRETGRLKRENVGLRAQLKE